MITATSLKNLLDTEQRFNLGDRVGFMTFRGSILHGLYEEGVSDVDVIGFTVPPLSNVFPVAMKPYEQSELKTNSNTGTQYDVLIYSLVKFINLLTKSNPNVMDLLYVPKQMIIADCWQYQLLVENRHLFTSKKIASTFCGYASNQLKSMQNSVYTRDMGEKRKNLVDTYGYDVKNASCLILLLKQGIDFFKFNTFYSPHPDVMELQAIRNGKYTLEEITQQADKLMDELHTLKQISTIPDEVDIKNIQRLTTTIMSVSYSTEMKQETERLEELINVKNKTIH